MSADDDDFFGRRLAGNFDDQVGAIPSAKFVRLPQYFVTGVIERLFQELFVGKLKELGR